LAIGNADQPAQQRLSDSRVANLGAHAVHSAFDAYHGRFRAITGRARGRFERCDWQGLRADGTERLDLYREAVDSTVQAIRDLLGERVGDRLVWAGMKAVYSGLISARDDWELAETFFNSISRRTLQTVGVDAAIEFVDSDFDVPPTESVVPVCRPYEGGDAIAQLVRRVLEDFRFQVGYEDLERDAGLAAAAIVERLTSLGLAATLDGLEVVTSVFYRNKGAYLIGRLRSGEQWLPMAIALLNQERGLVVDAVLLDEDIISIVFSFAYSYFHVHVDRPYDLVHFLKLLMPRKRLGELYISIGYHKHGKTELYRDLKRALESGEEQFEIAPGKRGMVMEVFVLPGAELVVKIIKDRFDEPKRTTRKAVMQKYHLVFRHDRAGRLVDAQEFEHLRFARSHFRPELLDELSRVAADGVSVEGEEVVLKHAYIERQVTPLDLYLRESDFEARRAAVLDYGNAIKDMAASNIFPGDLLLKNFGVTRHKRVVFYDYDELLLLTDCHFKSLPPPSDELEEFSSEPWYSVSENDVFPEEFRSFLRFPGRLGEAFKQRHADLFEVDYWTQMQACLAAGEVPDIFPYPQSRRLLRGLAPFVDGRV
jgi:isocitrate dehydrogenase kinase/phosphatase